MSILALDLSPAIVAILNRIARSRLYGTAIVQRAKCILFAYRKRQFTDISTLLRLSAKAVGRWVKRFRGSLDALRQVESNGVKSVLFRQVVDCLRDAPRSGHPQEYGQSPCILVRSFAQNSIRLHSKAQLMAQSN